MNTSNLDLARRCSHALLDADLEKLRSPETIIPWDALRGGDGGIAGLIASACDTAWLLEKSARARFEECLITFLQRGIDEDCLDVCAFRHGTRNGIRFVDPIISIIVEGFARVLAFYLERGFDPGAQYGPDWHSAIDVARKWDQEELVGMMMASVARRRTARALDQLVQHSEIPDPKVVSP